MQENQFNCQRRLSSGFEDYPNVLVSTSLVLSLPMLNQVKKKREWPLLDELSNLFAKTLEEI